MQWIDPTCCAPVASLFRCAGEALERTSCPGFVVALAHVQTISSSLSARFQIHSAGKKIMKSQTARWLVPNVIPRVRILLGTRNWIYQSGASDRVR